MKVKEFMDAIRLFNHPKYDDYEIEFTTDRPRIKDETLTVSIDLKKPKVEIHVKKADI